MLFASKTKSMIIWQKSLLLGEICSVAVRQKGSIMKYATCYQIIQNIQNTQIHKLYKMYQEMYVYIKKELSGKMLTNYKSG